jgi:putative CocE/NonD family hydrolase
MFLGGVLNAYAVGVAAGAAATHLVIGPWAHAHYGIPQSVAGELDFGPTAEVELWPMLERFFAPAVGPAPAATMAGVQYFTMGINEWRSADVWPPEATSVEFFIHSEGGPAATGVTGALDMVAPADEPADEWVHDPLVPVPSTGGQTWGIPNGPMDQSLLVERTDVLAYDSEALIADVEVTGAVHADLWIETDAVSADIVAALVDVHPDGRRYLVTQGILRRGSRSSPLYAEWSTNFKVDLWATSHVFLPGHRISLHIAASDFPHWDVNPCDGDPWPTSSEPRAVKCRIAHDAARPSMVVLPIVGEVPTRSSSSLAT